MYEDALGHINKTAHTSVSTLGATVHFYMGLNISRKGSENRR